MIERLNPFLDRSMSFNYQKMISADDQRKSKVWDSSVVVIRKVERRAPSKERGLG